MLCYCSLPVVTKNLVTLPLFVNEANTVFDIIERSCSPCTQERITLIKEMIDQREWDMEVRKGM